MRWRSLEAWKWVAINFQRCLCAESCTSCTEESTTGLCVRPPAPSSLQIRRLLGCPTVNEAGKARYDTAECMDADVAPLCATSIRVTRSCAGLVFRASHGPAPPASPVVRVDRCDVTAISQASNTHPRQLAFFSPPIASHRAHRPVS